jgi:hypothetical protein
MASKLICVWHHVSQISDVSHTAVKRWPLKHSVDNAMSGELVPSWYAYLAAAFGQRWPVCVA